MENQYYDGTKLLSLKDLNGSTPEIYICTTNRSGGKTTFFNRMVVNRFKKKGEKFILLYRFQDELKDCADKFFKDIKGLFFQNDTMIAKRMAGGMYYELLLNDESCGYAIALNSADKIKKYSHMFSDATSIIFDEFQSETNRYCGQEIRKFMSVHTSIARGKGKFVRYVPVYMLSNPVSIINPYYSELGIMNRLNDNTRFLRGDGWVLEQGFVEGASKAQLNSAFNRAFAGNDYTAYSAQCVYLNDSTAFIEIPDGKSKYLATLKYNGTNYAIREYADLGYVYCDTRADMSFPFKIAVSTDDHNINYIMLKRNDIFLSTMRFYFDKGCFRFKDLRCKEAVLKALSY